MANEVSVGVGGEVLAPNFTPPRLAIASRCSPTLPLQGRVGTERGERRKE
jgi:hypothetical protein